MILTREEYLKRIQGRIGEDNSEEAIKDIEDFTDTFDDFANRVASKEDWKAKYEENNKMWADKYKARFFASGVDTPQGVKEEQKDDIIDDGKATTFDDLFVEREG